MLFLDGELVFNLYWIRISSPRIVIKREGVVLLSPLMEILMGEIVREPAQIRCPRTRELSPPVQNVSPGTEYFAHRA